MTRRQSLSFVLAGLAVAGLSACGRRNQPEHPEGSEYPQQYPYTPPSAAAASKSTKDAAKEGEEIGPLRLQPKTGYGH